MLNPLILLSLGLDLHSTKHVRGGGVRPQRSLKVTLVVTLDPEGTLVLLLLDIHAPVAVIAEADLAVLVVLALRDLHGDGQSIGEGLIELTKLKRCAVDGEPTVEGEGIMLIVLECTVTDELSVDTAIAGVVDVLHMHA